MTPTPARLLVLAASALLAACAPTTPSFDDGFGLTTRQLMAQQVRHPQATQVNADRPVDGIDGRAGREVHERYIRGFIEPVKPAPIFNLGGSGGSGDSGGER
jgi:hypothetical protein